MASGDVVVGYLLLKRCRRRRREAGDGLGEGQAVLHRQDRGGEVLRGQRPAGRHRRAQARRGRRPGPDGAGRGGVLTGAHAWRRRHRAPASGAGTAPSPPTRAGTWPEPSVARRQAVRPVTHPLRGPVPIPGSGPSDVVKVNPMSTPPRFDRGHTDDLMSFLAASPSPYHAVANAAERLEKAGFRQVAETDAWDGTSGGKYVLRGGAIVAWYVPEGAEPHTPFRIVGRAHRLPQPAGEAAPGQRGARLAPGRGRDLRRPAAQLLARPGPGPRRTAVAAGRLDAPGEHRPAAAARAPTRHPPGPFRQHGRPQARQAAASAAHLGPGRRRARRRPDRASWRRSRGWPRARSPAGT